MSRSNQFLRLALAIPALFIIMMYGVGCSPSRESMTAANEKFARLGGGSCQISDLVGFQDLENWGVWSAKNPAKIILNEALSGAYKIRVVAYTMNDAPTHELKITIGDVTRAVTLTPQPTAFDLNYSLSRPTKEIVLSGIAPRSAKAAGLGGDTREVAAGFVKLDCGPG
jgi:hypothetical protein